MRFTATKRETNGFGVVLLDRTKQKHVEFAEFGRNNKKSDLYKRRGRQKIPTVGAFVGSSTLKRQVEQKAGKRLLEVSD